MLERSLLGTIVLEGTLVQSCFINNRNTTMSDVCFVQCSCVKEWTKACGEWKCWSSPRFHLVWKHVLIRRPLVFNSWSFVLLAPGIQGSYNIWSVKLMWTTMVLWRGVHKVKGDFRHAKLGLMNPLNWQNHSQSLTLVQLSFMVVDW